MKDNLIKYFLALTLGITASFFVFRIDFLQRIELILYNIRFELKVPNQVSPQIVLVAIDSETRKKYGDSIPYSEYTKLIKIADKARVIAFDIPFIQFTDPDDISKLSETLKGKNNVVLSSQFVGGIFQQFGGAVTYIVPIPMLSKYARYGYDNYIPDIDGVVRRAASSYTFMSNSRIEHSFSSVVSEVASGQKDESTKIYFINYRSKPGNFKKYSFHSVSENIGQFKELFAGKIVLVGSDFDIYKSPFIFNNEITRMELHANNITAILSQNHITKVNFFVRTFILLFMLFLGALPGIYLRRNKAILAIVSIIFVYTVFNFILFLKFNLYLSLFTPILGNILSFLFIKYYIYNSRNKEITRIKSIFKPNLTPQMLDEIIRKKDYIEALKGERRVVSVIFSDIADFTSLSEKLPTDEVVAILNEFLTQMTNVIFKNNGTLDKYMGDGVMAVFGSIGKVEIQENAFRAVKTAIEMRNELEHLQKKWIANGLMPLQIRIGVSTGEALVGNIGSPQQMDFTVIGDIVNTASRLEELNKKMNTSTLISKGTYEYVKDLVKVKELGAVSLKGKNEKVEIYELIGWKN